MKRTSLELSIIVALICCATTAAAPQTSMQPTPQPTAAADNEPWFRDHEPVMVSGNLYYPGGTAIHFIANEMVLSGLYRGIPLYSRTTIEPNSVVFVPLNGGMMQPYERRRDRDLAGTTGSSVSAFPIEIPSAFPPPRTLQAAAPPVVSSQPVEEISPDIQVASSPMAVADSRVTNHGAATQPAVGTAGRVQASPIRMPRRRGAANAIFVEYDHARWFSAAPPEPRDSGDLTLIGEWHGFPVYSAAGRKPSTIYIPIALGINAYAAYSRKP